MRQKEKKETILPKPCVCGKAAAMVRRRGGYHVLLPGANALQGKYPHPMVRP